MVQLQHFNRSIPFYMLLSDTPAFVKMKSLVVTAMAYLEDGRVPYPPMTFTEMDARHSIIIYSSGRRSVSRHTRQPNLTGLLLST